MKVQIKLIDNPQGKQLAFASVAIPFDGVEIVMDDFTIVSGAKGLFVGFPQGKPFEKDGKTIYLRKIHFNEQLEDGAFFGPVQRKFEQAILAAYNTAVGNGAGNDRVAAAQAHEDQVAPSGARPASKARTAASW